VPAFLARARRAALANEEVEKSQQMPELEQHLAQLSDLTGGE
jgi:hypothetical protein